MKLNISVDGITFGTMIDEVEVPPALRIKRASGIEAWDDAMGGKGMTPSAICLFTGTPGGGKTTLMLSVASSFTARGVNVLYNTAEESAFQVRMTYDRLRLSSSFRLGQVTNVKELTAQCDEIRKQDPTKPFILIQDSLQTLDDGHFKNGRITTATAERACQHLTNWTKAGMDGVDESVRHPNTIVIGQVNKSGKMAGANKLKHMVDALVHLSVETNEDSEWFDCRKVFTEKNRFGGAGFLSFLRMSERGLTLVGKVGNVVHG
jgi:DNA repair protein RadA/Sms